MFLMSKNKITSIFIILITSYLFYSNEHLKGPQYDLLGSKYFPRIICITIIILGIVLFFSKDEEALENERKKRISYIPIFLFLIISICFLLALHYNLGFLISSFLYVFILTFMINKWNIKDFINIALFSFISCYTIYFVFNNFLSLILP
jgi:uncharacterized membrane protein YadS